jgi:glycosyltransferase involved in cell wall biosynthesis
MKIIRYYPRAFSGDGGMTNAVRHWSEGFVRAGAEVVIAYADGEVPPSWQKNKVECRKLRHVGPPRCKIALELGDTIKDADVLVLHSAWAPHNNWAGRVARRLRIPYVLEPRGAYDPQIVRRHQLWKKPWWWTFERELVMNARAVHVFFPSEVEHLRSLGYNGEVIIAPNGVETPDAIRWDGGSGKYVLWMGRFDPEHKGIDVLVRAMKLIESKRRPILRLRGPDWRTGKAKVQQLIARLGLGAWVKVEEPIHGLGKFKLLARSSGFVYPSRWEGFGNSVAEAVSVGVPTIVTPYPLGRYLAARGGAILAQPTPEGLAGALESLSSCEAPGIAARGAEIVHKEITWDAVSQQWLSQLKPLL